MKYLDLANAHRLPIGVRLRVALDLLGARSNPAQRARITLKELVVATTGQASVARLLGPHTQVATLLWEIVAAKPAETDDLPWSDPAEDLPDAVLDVFAAWTVRRPASMDELRSRFVAAVERYAATHAEVAALIDAPQRIATPLAPSPLNPITVRAPAVQVEALQTLSRTMDHGAPSTPAPCEEPEEDLFATRRCSVAVVEELVALSQAKPAVEQAQPAPEPATPSITNEHSGSLEPFTTEDTSSAANAEVTSPGRRSNARSFVVVSLAACAAVLAVAGIKLHGRGEPASAHEPPATETASVVDARSAPPATEPLIQQASGPAQRAEAIPTVVASVLAQPSVSVSAKPKAPAARVLPRRAPPPPQPIPAEVKEEAAEPLPPLPVADPVPAPDPSPPSAGAPPPVEL